MPKSYGSPNSLSSHVLRAAERVAYSAARDAIQGGAQYIGNTIRKNVNRATSTTYKRPNTQRTRASTKRRIVFPRRRNYYTQGRMGKKFKRGRKFKPNKFLKSGDVQKLEVGFTQSDTECVYVGHVTHPVTPVWNGMWMAFARKIAQAIHSDYTNINTQINAGGTIYRWNFNYQLAADGPLITLPEVTIAASDTWKTLAQEIGDQLLTVIVPGTNYFALHTFYLWEQGTGVRFNQKTWKFKNMTCQIVGNSNLQVQNRTQAPGAGDESNMLDVANNPLRGKVYHGYGAQHKYKFNNDAIGTIPIMGYNNVTGQLALGSDNANFTLGMQKVLRKPPVPSAFTNIRTAKYTTIKPGEIRRSSLTHSLKKSYNEWIRMLLPYLQETTVDFFEIANSTFGKNSFMALEKTCDSGDEGKDVTVGCELVVTMSTVCHYKQNMVLIPDNTFY